MMQFTILAATQEPEGIAALGIDPWTIIAQGVTFLLFFFLIKKFALTKIVTTLENRRTTIESSLDQAEELKKQNEQAQKRVNEALHEARVQSEEILDKTRKEASSIIASAEGLATDKAERIITDGKLQREAEGIKARESLKKETLALVAQATSALLEETVDVKKNEAIIKNHLLI